MATGTIELLVPDGDGDEERGINQLQDFANGMSTAEIYDKYNIVSDIEPAETSTEIQGAKTIYMGRAAIGPVDYARQEQVRQARRGLQTGWMKTVVPGGLRAR